MDIDTAQARAQAWLAAPRTRPQPAVVAEVLDALLARIAQLEQAPSVDAAYQMGATGGACIEEERLAFEAWMRGHCWALSAEWNGQQYVGLLETKNRFCPAAAHTRGLWAAWRDRAALRLLDISSVSR